MKSSWWNRRPCKALSFHADVGRWELLSTSKHFKEFSSFSTPNAASTVLLPDAVHQCPFLLCVGVINIPAVALGMFSGGLVMKKYKLGVMGAAKFAFGTSLLGFVLSLFFLAMGCENSKVAGITVSYSGCVCPHTDLGCSLLWVWRWNELPFPCHVQSGRPVFSGTFSLLRL